MAKSDNSLPTLKAVLVYAAELRDRADRARSKDPYVEPYAPSDDVAHKVCQEQVQRHGKDDGPRRALEVLASRARSRELAAEEDGARASAARGRLLGVQAVARGERVAELSNRTLAQRLHEAMATDELLSQVPAAQLDPDPVKSSKPSGGGLPSRRDRQRDDLLHETRRIVERWEREVASHRRRLVEEEAA